MNTTLLERNELIRLLEMGLESATDTFVILDGDLRHPDGPRVLYMNKSAIKANAKTAAEMIGHRLYSLYPADARAALIQQFERAAQTKLSFSAETTFTAQTKGSFYWFEIDTIPILDDQGEAGHFVRIGRNITARKRAEQSRQTTQRLLASIFGVIDQALGVVDEHGSFTMINTALTRQIGWGVFDVVGKNLQTIVEEADRERVWEEVRKNEAETSFIKARFMHRDGRVLSGEIVSTAIEQTDQRQYYVLNFISKVAEIGGASPIGAAVQKLLSRLGENTVLVAGKLQLVGLAAVRKQLGDRWPAISERVFMTAEQILRRHLDDADVYERTADDGFVICFGKLSEAEAQLKARVISNEIRERLIGDVPEASEGLVNAFAAAIPVAPADNGEWDDVHATLESRLNRERLRLEQDALNMLRTQIGEGVVTFQSIRNEANQPAQLLYCRLPAGLEQSIFTLEGLGQSGHRLEAEMLLLTGAAERVLADLGQNKSDVILVPIRLETLANRRDLDHFLKLARSLGDPGRQRIGIEVTNLSRDTAGLRISDLTMMLSSMFRTVAFELPGIDPAFIGRLPISVQVVTVPIQRLGADGSTTQAGAASKLVKLVTTRRCRLVVKEVSNTAQAMSMARVGVKLLLTSQVV